MPSLAARPFAESEFLLTRAGPENASSTPAPAVMPELAAVPFTQSEFRQGRVGWGDPGPSWGSGDFPSPGGGPRISSFAPATNKAAPGSAAASGHPAKGTYDTYGGTEGGPGSVDLRAADPSAGADDDAKQPRMGHATDDSGSNANPARPSRATDAKRVVSGHSAIGGEIWGCGSGFAAQLGPGISDAQLCRRLPILPAAVVRVAAGAAHSAALLGEGRVVTWGCNDDGALGRTEDEAAGNLVPRFGAKGGVLAKAIVCGDAFVAALDNMGRVWAWGSFYDPRLGRIGFNAACDMALRPQLVTAGGLGHATIAEISAGENHILARSDGGLLFEWGAPLGPLPGSGEDGRPQMMALAQRWLVPRVLPLICSSTAAVDGSPARLYRVMRAWAGGKQSYASVDDGTVWAWGLDNYGQLACGRQVPGEWASAPRRCQKLEAAMRLGESVREIAAGPHHALALLVSYDAVTKPQRLLAWGRSHYGRLGLSPSAAAPETVEDPTPVAFPVGISSRIRQLACGEAHGLVLLEDGSVWAWGFNATGQLGLTATPPPEGLFASAAVGAVFSPPGPDAGADEDEVATPRRVPNLPSVSFIATAAQHSLFVAHPK